MPILDDLVSDLGFSFKDVSRIISTAPARYKVYGIPKRDGGFRIIAQPSRELKLIQRYILENKLNKCKIHECATAYVKNKSIYENAEVHKSADKIIKLDFSNFFNSIKPRDWRAMAPKLDGCLFEASDLEMYIKIFFWGHVKNSSVPRCLSVGAPTSPSISNILMYDFDQAVFAAAKELNINYTRYADDITLSGDSISHLHKMESHVRKSLKNISFPKLSINEKKRGLFTRAGRRSVTGLIITPDGSISIGRDKKRLISAMVHHFVTGEMTEEGKAKLKGWLAFCVDNEIEFVERLRIKYGNEAISKALKYYIKPLS